MSKFQVALEKLEQKALEKIKRKIIAYNKKKGERKYNPYSLPLKDEVCFNCVIGSSKTFVAFAELKDNVEVVFRTDNGYHYIGLSTEQIVEIADSL